MTSPFATLVQRVATTRVAEEAEVAYPRTRAGRLLSLQVFPLGDGIGAVWRDITELRTAEMTLAQSEARYRALAEGTPAAAWLARADGALEYINQAMSDILGRPREVLLGEGWMEAIDPDDRAAILKERMVAWSTHRVFHYEGRFRHAEGRPCG